MSLPALGRTLVALSLLLAAASCAAGTAAPRDLRAGADVITRAEIDEVAVGDAYELVQRLRPRWLVGGASRSVNLATQILVFLNGTRLGGVEALRSVSTAGITSLEYMDALTATSMLSGIGSDHVAGAIIVHTGAQR